MERRRPDTSWDRVSGWYGKIAGDEGHYYQKAVIFPRLLELLGKNVQSVLDLACGNGVLCTHLPKTCRYTGIDLAPSLIREAERRHPDKAFHVGDITKELPDKGTYQNATIILAIQNVEHPLEAFKQAYQRLEKGGRLFIVMNHPCFRIPRQSSWGVEPVKKMQYRRVDRYMEPMKIPIQTSPSRSAKSETVISFHYPLCDYTKWLMEAGFVITNIEEWCSDKDSTGGNARMENRARKEFPLFLTLCCQKL